MKLPNETTRIWKLNTHTATLFCTVTVKNTGSLLQRCLVVLARTSVKLRAIGVEATTLQLCVITRTLNVASAEKNGHRAKRRVQETSMPSQNTRKNMFVIEEVTQDKMDRTHQIFILEDQSNDPARMQVLLNNIPVDMVLDIGASVSLDHQSNDVQLAKTA